MLDVLTGIAILLSLYVWLFLMDRFFKSCSHYAYIQFLKGTGLEVKFLQIKWSTTAFNATLERWGSAQSYWLNMWFQVGLCVSLILLPVSMFFVLYALVDNFATSTKSSIIEPALPGVNIPASEIGYYSITMLISSVLHEIGHAVAGAQEDVNIIDVGANILFILPVSWVNLGRDKLFSLSPWKRLKVLCAGIWHNTVLSLIAYLLFVSLPYTLSPLYHYNSGVYVAEIEPNTLIHGGKGLYLGDTLTVINDCKITNEDGWFECLLALKQSKPAFCLDEDTVHNLDESVPLKHLDNGLISCCRAENEGRLCFEYMDVADGILELPPFVCLPGRKAIEFAQSLCTNQPHSCPETARCFKPILANGTNLFRISRRNSGDVFYIGPISDLVRWLRVSSYVPKLTFFTSRLADVISKFLKYTVIFSFGLAFVNVLPCMFMDGQYIINTLLHVRFTGYLRSSHINMVSGIVTAGFTVLLIVHCLIVVKAKFY